LDKNEEVDDVEGEPTDGLSGFFDLWYPLLTPDDDVVVVIWFVLFTGVVIPCCLLLIPVVNPVPALNLFTSVLLLLWLLPADFT